MRERLLGLDLRGDVLERALEKDRCTGRVADDPRILADPDAAAVATVDLHPDLVDPAEIKQTVVPDLVGLLVYVDVAGSLAVRQQQLRRGVVAQDARHGRIGIQEAAPGQASVDSLGRRQEQVAIKTLATVSFLGLVMLG